MTRSVHFGRPDEAKAIVQHLQAGLDSSEDEWHVLGNLFNPDRLDWADEAVFLKTEDGEVLALALICKLNPCVVSYYTAPSHRCQGHGYSLLLACISRISEASPYAPVLIEPTSEAVDNHIAKLPDAIRQHLRIM